MDRLELLRIFMRVVDSASFTRAANTLDLPRSTVSSAIRQLEERLGARLIHRTTRQVSATHDGLAFYERCQRLLIDYEEAESLFRGAQTHLHGKLRIDVPGRIGRRIIAPALPDFFAHHPDIEIELGVTDRAVDLIQEGIDCALRVGPLSDSTLIARKVADLALVNCASPAYLESNGTPRRIADLDRHFAVNYASPATGKIEEWEWVEKSELRTRPMQARVTVNNAEAYIACCLAGLGLIQVPAYDVADHLASGKLVEVLPRHRAAPMPMHIVYSHRQHLSRRLKAFVDWLTVLLGQRISA
ncbi:LysR family transcriptional regulator [Hyphomicrobium sp. LHD-15]|uniref:LysR family transcriptional regulator n=1 Tax=Hyphomicrobium sp. LHD-15 TaxID=3072142 RepID=UPI0028107D90|nr:LysR family transcriptional regulator [Hyphomicrobium sp. LHD-15]MDQ8699570.1 LysR family transcriptional regulator [Hyphomicrobium sp. LHD-15]